MKKLFAASLLLSILAGCGSNGTGAVTSATDSSGSTSTTDTTAAQVVARAGGPAPSGQPGPTGQQPPPPPPPGSGSQPHNRSIDGTGNNPQNLGSTGEVFFEDTSRAYGDGVNTPSGDSRANPREISNAVVDQTDDTPDPGGRTAFLWLWGQFVDHDITLTLDNGSNDFPISIPTGDPYFDPYGTGTQTLPFSRSDFDPSTGTSVDNPRAQTNSITAFIDASNVYGSDEERATALRTFSQGKLRTSDGNLPPYNTDGLANAGGNSASLFLCGDVRANENILLTCMHTVFLREHNRIADELARRFPQWTDEQIYQAARKRVGAEIAAITYNEFLPALLGRDAIPPYSGYKPGTDPRIGVLFATAAYRMGHSQVGSTVPRLDENGDEVPQGNLAIADAFFNPAEVAAAGIEPLLRGAAVEPSQNTDAKIIGDLRNFLFGPPGSGGLDLASLNIQRGRDHGLPDYNTVRREAGLQEAASFAAITADSAVQASLASVYSGPGDVDPWVGLLAEDHVPGAVVGPTLKRILSRQFVRLRDGDRFFYLNDPDLAQERDAINATRLAQVIARNTGITTLQPNVFFGADTQPRPRPPVKQPDRRVPCPLL